MLPPEEADRALRLKPPKSKKSRALPYFLGVLWLALAVGLAYIIVGQFQGKETSVAQPSPAPPEPLVPTGIPETQAVPAPPQGSISFNVIPAKASLSAQYGDRKESGVGALKMEEIPEGTEVTLKASLKGYHGASQKIKIASPDLNVSKSITLKKKAPQYGSLTVGAHPYGRVTVPGYVSGRTTPISIGRIKVGTYSVRVSSGSKEQTVSGRARIRPGRKTSCRALWDRGVVACN